MVKTVQRMGGPQPSSDRRIRGDHSARKWPHTSSENRRGPVARARAALCAGEYQEANRQRRLFRSVPASANAARRRYGYCRRKPNGGRRHALQDVESPLNCPTRPSQRKGRTKHFGQPGGDRPCSRALFDPLGRVGQDHRPPARQLRSGVSTSGEWVGAASAPDFDAFALLKGEDAEAVVFDLMQPAGAGGRLINECGFTRTDEDERSVQPPTGWGARQFAVFNPSLPAI
jgi:hypothetical protein